MRENYRLMQAFRMNVCSRLRILKRIMLVLFMILSFNLLGTYAYADSKDLNISDDQQQVRISGTIVDSDGNPLPGVNVIVKGTTIGTATDINGKYTLMVPSQNDILVATFIGFISSEVPVGSRSVVDITLTSEATALEEVDLRGMSDVDQDSHEPEFSLNRFSPPTGRW